MIVFLPPKIKDDSVSNCVILRYSYDQIPKKWGEHKKKWGTKASQLCQACYPGLARAAKRIDFDIDIDIDIDYIPPSSNASNSCRDSWFLTVEANERNLLVSLMLPFWEIISIRYYFDLDFIIILNESLSRVM